MSFRRLTSRLRNKDLRLPFNRPKPPEPNGPLRGYGFPSGSGSLFPWADSRLATALSGQSCELSLLEVFERYVLAVVIATLAENRSCFLVADNRLIEAPSLS